MIQSFQEFWRQNPEKKQKLKSKPIFTLFICLLLGIGGVRGQSTNLVSWDFNTSVTNANYATNTTNQNGARSTALTNVTISTISINGTGVSGVNSNTFHRTTGWPTSSSTSHYLQFSITLTSGETFANQPITVSIGAQVSSTSTAARNYTVTYGYGSSPTFSNATYGTVTNTGTATTTTSNISIPSPGNTTTSVLTVRILVFGSTSGSGNFRVATIGLTGYTPISSTPTINASLSNLSTFNSSAISTPSAEQSFTVSGSNLTNDITVTAPTGYQVSTTSGSGFGSSVTLNQSGGSVSATTVYTRFNPTALANQVGGNITCTSTGATTQNVTVSGEVTNLSAGAVAFIAFQGVTTDYFRIVAMEDIPANTRIWFTDKAWDGNSGVLAFTTGEATGLWTNSTGSTISRGTVIEFDPATGLSTIGSGGLTSGLGSAGEQLFAYQGTVTSPSFLGGYTSGTVISTGTPTASGTDTWVPTSLTQGVNFIALGGITFGSSYVTSSTLNLSVSDMRTHIHTFSNLTTTNTATTSNSSWPTYTFNFIADQPTSQPSFSAATSVGNNQMTLNFSGGNGSNYLVVMRQGSAVDALPVDATNYSAVSGSVNFSTATELSAGQRIVYNGATSGTSVTVTNLSPGTTYHYAIYAYNGSGRLTNFNTTTPGTGNETTTGTSNSTASDIFFHSSFTEPENIAYHSYQENSDLTSGNSIEVARFTLRDGGASTDADANSTTLTAISFTVTNHSVIRRLALYNGSTELAEIAVGSATANFSGISLSASDNSSQDFSLRASFSASVNDNTQFSFTISSATADPAGSTFAVANAGGAATSTTGDRNRIEVTATALAFVQQPSNVPVNTAVSPSPTVSANDALGNRDLDYVTDMTVTTTGTFGSATTVVTPTAGLGTFDNLQFSTAATARTIAVSSGSLNSTGNSNTFDVNSLLLAGDVAFIKYQSDAPDEFSIITFVDIPASQTFYFTDNQWTTASGPLATNEQTMTWTTPGTIIPAGTVITFSNPSGSFTDITPSGNGSASGALNGISSAGDQIFMYRGTSGSPTQFICGLNFGNSGAWQSISGLSTNSSFLPSDLTNNINAISFSSDLDNGYYSNTQSGPIATLKALINNGANWTRNDNLQTPPTWSFTINSTNTTISGNTTVQNLSISIGESITIGSNTLTVNGSISGSGSLVGSASSNLVITGASGTIYLDQTTPGTTNVLRNLTISGTGTTTLGNALNITGGVTPGVVTIGSGSTLAAGSNLTLKSDANGTARVGASAGLISGNVTVERFIPGSSGRRYRYLAAPFAMGPTLSASWQQQIHITGAGSGGSLCPSPSPNSNGFDATLTNAPSMFTFNETTAVNTNTAGNSGGTVYNNAWVSIANTTSTTLEAGKGYKVFVRGNKSQGCDLINGTNPSPNDVTLSASGQLAQGSFNFGISYSANNGQGWNLVGNPYPSAIDWNSNGWTKTNLDDEIHIFKPSGNHFASYNGLTQAGTNGGSNLIESGNAFFVKANGSSPVLIATESVKAGSSPATPLFKNQLKKLSMTLVKLGQLQDEILVGMAAEASDAKDPYDTEKMSNPALNLYSKSSDGNLQAINIFKAAQPETRIPIGITSTFTGEHRFSFKGEKEFDAYDVLLEDRFAGVIQLVNDRQSYSFDITSNPASFGEGRFSLLFVNRGDFDYEKRLKSIYSNMETSIRVYPNPSTGLVQVQSTNLQGNFATVKVFDAIGTEIQFQELAIENGVSSFSLDLSNQPSGVYVVEIFDNSGNTRMTKVVKTNN